MSLIGRLLKLLSPAPERKPAEASAAPPPRAAPKPYFHPVSGAGKPAASPVGAPRRNMVLVVDDDEKIRELLTDFLESLGYKVTTASDGWQAAVQAEGMNFRLIISDIQMPGPQGTGLHAYAALRKSTHVRKDLPLIFVTGMDPKKLEPYLPKDPRVRVLFKPIDLGLMKKTVDELLATP